MSARAQKLITHMLIPCFALFELSSLVLTAGRRFSEPMKQRCCIMKLEFLERILLAGFRSMA
ncbi:hypothetical protein B9T65_08820 [Serratia marcescens]|nr:hypothetical protein B9T65_08820 [Serratia marcescens]